MKKLLLPLFTVCLLCNIKAQSLINLSSKDTTKSANLNYPFQAGFKIDSNRVLILSSVANSLTGSAVAVTLYKNTGMVSQWQVTSSFPDSEILTPTAACQSGNYIYGCFGFNELGTGSGFGVAKFSIHNGTEPWSDVYNSSGYYQLPAAIIADSLGKYIYVAGVQQTGPTTSEAFITKIDSAGNQKWTATYDTAGMYSGAVAMVLNSGGGTITFTGFSGNAWNNWDFITASVRTDSGIMTKPSFSAAGTGYSTPAGLVKDYSNHTYIAGTINAGSSSSRIRVIAYDTSFSQRWERTWGNADSLADSASRVVMDFDDNILITGYTTGGNNVKQLLVLKYNTADSLLWSRIVSAPNPNYAMAGNDITSDDSLNVYVTGKVWNGSNWDYVTIAFDQNGNTLWEQTYNGAGNNDVANDIITDNTGDVFVSGTSISATTSTYVTLEYTKFSFKATAVLNGSGKPIYAANKMIVRVPAKYIDTATINNRGIAYGTPSSFYSAEFIDSLAKYINTKAYSFTVGKLYGFLTVNDTLSTSRQNTKVRIPPFWNILVWYLPTVSDTSSFWVDSLIARLNAQHLLISYASHNHIGQLASAPDDPLYSTKQTGLFSGSGNINVQNAWNRSTGNDSVLVGIIDAGVDKTHQDLQRNYAGGFDDDQGVITPVIPPYDTIGHGTQIAGIIGATRDNNLGVAGIAGGDSIAGTHGALLYDLNAWSRFNNWFDVEQAGGLAFYAASQYSDAFGDTFGIGVHVLNNSYYENLVAADGNDDNQLRKNFEFCFSQGVVLVCSRGNSDTNTYDLPASFKNPNMVISVTGSGTSGSRLSTSNYGNHVDFVAPGDTTMYDAPISSQLAPNNSTYGRALKGCSAAAAHVSGASALLLGYVNAGRTGTENLTPEDVEYLFRNSSKSEGVDSLAGYGLINVDSAMSLADTENYKILHFYAGPGDTTAITRTTENDGLGWDFNMGSDQGWVNVFGEAGLPLVPGGYYGTEYKVYTTHSHTIPAGYTFVTGWVDNSGSCGIVQQLPTGLFNNPFEYIYQQSNAYNVAYQLETNIGTTSITSTSASLFAYYYHYTAQAIDSNTTSPVDVWFPGNLTSAPGINPQIQMMYSILIKGHPASVDDVENSSGSLLAYPNPAHNAIHFELHTVSGNEATLKIYNPLGQTIAQSPIAENTYYTLNTASFVSGAYVAIAKTGEEMYVRKFIVTH